MRFRNRSCAASLVIVAIMLPGACQRGEAPAAGDPPPAATTPAAGEAVGAARPDSGPAGTTPAPAQSELAGTSWQLVEIQSMDGKTYAPDERAKYTITFGADGRAGLRVDCNRGSTSWTSTVSSELRFGEAIMMTKVACPPGSLYDRVVRDLPYVRTYTMKDGHLYLALMADGAIYEFEPRTGDARD